MLKQFIIGLVQYTLKRAILAKLTFFFFFFASEVKINLQGLWLMTNQYSDLNINLKDLKLSYKHLELNQKYLRNESFGFKFKSQLISH